MVNLIAGVKIGYFALVMVTMFCLLVNLGMTFKYTQQAEQQQNILPDDIKDPYESVYAKSRVGHVLFLIVFTLVGGVGVFSALKEIRQFLVWTAAITMASGFIRFLLVIMGTHTTGEYLGPLFQAGDHFIYSFGAEVAGLFGYALITATSYWISLLVSKK